MTNHPEEEMEADKFFSLESNSDSEDDISETDAPVDNSTLLLVSQCIGENYQILGLVLGVSDSKMKRIENDRSRMRVEEKAHKVLKMWKKRKGKQATKNMLVRLLNAISRQDVVQQISSMSLNDSSCQSHSKGKQPTLAINETITLGSTCNETGGDCTEFDITRMKEARTRSSTLEYESDDDDNTAEAEVDNAVVREVSRRIGKDYRMLGRELGVSDSDIQAIEIGEKEMGKQETAYVILLKWKDSDGKNATKRKLNLCLKKIERRDILQHIKRITLNELKLDSNFYKQSTGTSENDRGLLRDIQTRLIESYKQIVLKGLPWMEGVNITLSEYYVELMMVQQDKHGVDRPKASIQLNEIFNVSHQTEKKQRSILVEGGPGYGKTTFACKLCYDFAQKTEYINHFDIVLVLPLREFAGNLHDMLVKVSRVGKEDSAGLLSIVHNQSITMLLILEGYDELSAKLRPVINSLISGEIFPHATVIVTSRPGEFGIENDSKQGNLRASCDASIVSNPFETRIRITGIHEEKLAEFVGKHLEDFSVHQRNEVYTQLREFLLNDIVTENFLQCPLMLLMMILLLTNTDHTTSKNLKTKTDIYKALLNFVLRRYLIKTGREYAELPDLFSVNYAQRPFYIDLVSQFGQFSLEALKSDNLAFSRETVLQHSNGDERILDLGLLNKSIAVVGFYKKPYYEPVHKSLMEFAAAYFLWITFSSSSLDQWQMAVCSYRPRKSNKSSFVLYFLAGLLKENLPALFDALLPFAAEFKSRFSLFGHILIEAEITPKVLTSLLPFLPLHWELHNQVAFANSSQYKEILNFGLKHGEIKRLTWDGIEDIGLPDDVYVEKMEFIFTHLSCNNKNMSCEELYCYFDKSSPISDIQLIMPLILSIRYQHISFLFMDFAGTLILPSLVTRLVTNTRKVDRIRRIVCVLGEEVNPTLAIITDLIKKDIVEGLYVHLKPIPESLFLPLLHQHIDYLVTTAANSCHLQQFVLRNGMQQQPKVELAHLLNANQKSWEWVWLDNVQINCTKTILNPNLQIRQLFIEECDLTNMAVQRLHSFQVTSLYCNPTFLTSYRFSESLNELCVLVNECIFTECFQHSLQQLKNLQILTFTMRAFDYHSLSVSVDDWLANSISCMFKLSGFEIHLVEDNFDLATELVQALIKYLNKRAYESRLPQSNSSLSPSKQLKSPILHYAALLSEIKYKDKINLTDDEGCTRLISLVSTMKQPLRDHLFSRLEITVNDTNSMLSLPTLNQDDSTCLSNVFSVSEGFTFEQDLRGMREDDSLYNRQILPFYVFGYKRVSVSFVDKK